MADYLDAFAAESEEQITELNNALLEFEDDPSDEAAMDQIFRTAHTLKGNCGAMGFEPAEELAHALEDLLEAIRSNRVAVTPELMDAVFAGVDELDAMISEAVETGEVTRTADEEIETLREYAETEGIAEPTDVAIDELLGTVSPPSDSEHSVYHVRLDVAGDPAVHGRAVVDALDDAFELLGTDPDGDVIDAGDYDGTVDAAFASVVERAAVEAALEPVDAVADQVITDVTDRVEDASADAGDVASGAAAAGAGAQDGATDDLSVDELLEDDDVDQFDDLDEMAEDVGDTSEFDDLGDAGSFADLGISDEDVEIEGIDDEPADDAAEAEATSTDDAPADDEVEDAAAEFAELKQEVDPVGFDELQDELDDLEFDEYDSDEEVGFDELLDEDELEDDGSFAESSDSFDASADDSAETAAGDAAAETVPDAADAEVAGDDEPDATAEDLFGSADDSDAVSADAEAPAADDAGASAADDAEAPAADDEEISAADDEAPTADEGAQATDDDTAVVADAAEDDTAVQSDPSDETTVAADDDSFDAADVLDAESLDQSAQSFGEGGLDLSEANDEGTQESAEAVSDADDLDLDDSFGELEDAATAEAADDIDGESLEDESEALDFGEADVDFDEGTVPGPNATDADPDDESVGVGDAVADDSFDPDATDAAFDEDATTADDAEDAVETVDGFGDDSVLDLDSGSVAGGEAPPDGDEDALEPVEAEDVGPGARVTDDADAALDADDATLDADDGFEATTDDAADASQFDDPGFGEAPDETGAADVEVDEDRLERIRTLGVPQLDEDAKAGGSSTQSIRVDVESLDRMLNMVEGLVTSRARLRRALIENEPREILEDELDDLEDVTSELQDTVMDVRLVPLRTAVNNLPRIVRDVAREEDKDVDFEMVGEDVELDRSILDEIGDPLVHLVRNAVDHGIETPEVREEVGKDPEGSVELRATRERDRVSIVVEDDGAGIDADAVRDAAVEEGIHTRSEVDSMDDADVYELIFHSGFSTAAEVTDVSGRGVGMDVVAETVDRLDGTVSVESEPGEGTTIAMELPVTLAIAEVLFVDVGGEEYGIPIKTVDEIGPVVGVETQDGQEVLVSDGGEDRRELIRLDEALSTPGRSDPNSGMLVHLRDDVREAAIHCDQVREQQEVVVKPFEGVLGDVPGLSGASVLGDGDVVTILDVETL